MSDRRRLYDLLPAVYRIRDFDEGDPLRALFDVINEQVDIVGDDLRQLYENWFIETCAESIVPYIGDLVGARRTDIIVDQISGTAASNRDRFLFPRREIANTVRFRRRKGTLAVLEELSSDVADWPARAVEFGTLLAATPTARHPHPDSVMMLSVRDADNVDRMGGPFENVAHLPSVRELSTADASSRFGAHKLGLFVWKHGSFGVRRVPATCRKLVLSKTSDQPARLFQVNPLGRPIQLYIKPVPEPEPTSIAQEHHLPGRLRLTALAAVEKVPADTRGDGTEIRRESTRPVASTIHYGRNRSLALWLQQEDTLTFIDARDILPIDLSVVAFGGGTEEELTRLLQRLRRGPTPPGMPIDHGTPDARHIAAVDPRHGLVLTFERSIRASYHYGSLGQIGGGPYRRTFEPRQSSATKLLRISQSSERNQSQNRYDRPGEAAQRRGSLQEEILKALAGDATETIIEITDDQEYTIDRDLSLAANKTLQIRAADGRRPVIRLNRDRCSGGLRITLAEGSCLILDGLLIAENGLEVHGDNAKGSRRLEIRHCTLVPGGGSDKCGDAWRPSLEVNLAGGVVQIESSIVGHVRRIRREGDDPAQLRHPMKLAITDSIVDGNTGNSSDRPQAINGRDDFQTRIERSTLFGEVAVSTLTAQDSLFCDPVQVRVRDSGGLRYCYVRVCPDESVTPARYYCQPDLNRKQQASIRDCDSKPASHDKDRGREPLTPWNELLPRFVRVDGRPAPFGHAAYAQLADDCSPEIRNGAEDGGEMGVFQRLAIPHRARSLRDRLHEFTPVLMESDIFFAN